MGLIRPNQGEIIFNGRDITKLPAYHKAELGLILVPEGRQLFTSMTVAENLEMGATPKHARPQIQANLDRVYELFPRLKERQRQIAGTLSGGEQQMLAVARGIMAEPVVFMIDELSLGLAPAMSIQLLEDLIQLKQTGLTLLLVEQNVQMALAISDYAYVLSQGRTDLEGASRELIKNDKVRAAYLGITSEQSNTKTDNAV
jgi:branched-chain amino acid transport system ATP-binding protein